MVCEARKERFVVKVFVGTEDNQRLACEVMKYSVVSRCSEVVEFTEVGRDLQLPMQTGFSFARWEVPELCGFEGPAVYMDADIVVRADLAELLKIPMHGNVLARPTSDDRFFTSVMLFDCAPLDHWNFSSLVAQAKQKEWMYGAIMWASRNSPLRADFGELPRRWNDLDLLKADTAALHYTDLKRQPWRYAGHPFGWVFQTELKAAIQDGFITEAAVRAEMAKGHVRGDLLLTP